MTDGIEELYISSRKETTTLTIKSKACELLKEAIKIESDSALKYSKIKQEMPIEYMEYNTDLDVIRANRGRDKLRLTGIAKKVGCDI